MSHRISCLHYVREIRKSLGGVVSTVLDLCGSTAARGHRVVLVTCDAADVPSHWLDGGDRMPEVVVVAPSRTSKRLLSRSALQKCNELAETIDLAHLHTPWELGNYQLGPLFRRHSVPYVVTVHGMLDHYVMAQKAMKKRVFLSLGGRRLFTQATTIHFTAQSEQEQASTYVSVADRAFVESCAIDLSLYRDLPGLEPAYRAFPEIDRDKPKILFLSRVHPKKGLDLLLRAMKILRAASRSYQLLIAGPGEDRYIAELKSLAEELGVADEVQFLGMVSGVEKTSLYQTADVFVLPTHQENFGLVLPEAMACGTPVITTRGTDIWRELESGGATIVDESPSQIADAVVAVTADPERRRRLGEQGREFVYGWLDADRIAASYESMYFDAIRRGIPPFSSTAVVKGGDVVVAT